MTPPANRNQLWARALVDELARAGVTDVVIAPGSRSTPLVLAFAGDSRFRTTVQVDERCAGFLALGMGRGNGRPAAVVTTSGTAGANLYPAVVEASQGEVPLLVLTADRPHALRDSDANQAIDQIRLFGPFVRAFHEVAPPAVEDVALRHLRMLAGRAVAAAVGAPAGPVHLNLPFQKPLEPTPVPGDIPPGFQEEYPLATGGRPGGVPFVRITPRRSRASGEEVAGLREVVAAALRPVVVAGPVTDSDRVGPALQRFARRTGIPLLADPLSGGRHGAEEGTPVTAYHDLVLRSPAARKALRPDLVIRVGASPTSAAVLGWLGGLGDVPQVVVDGGGRWKDHLAVAEDVLPVDPEDLLDRIAPPGDSGVGGGPSRRSWSDLWQALGEAAGSAVADDAGPPFEGTVVASAARALPAGGELYVSSSMPVRDLDAFVPPRRERLHVRGNRGASGIDGIISTALGVRLATRGPMVAVLGDLAFYHDMNGLLAVRNSAPDLVFVVIQNDGGGIFHLLPIRNHEPAFTPFFATPHGLDFSRAAALYDLPHRVVPAAEVESGVARALQAGGPWILEVRSDREENRRRHEEVEAAVGARVQAVLAGAG